MVDLHDYIVVGGGPGGSVVANRLSTDVENKVCLIEAGGPGTGKLISIPLMLILNIPRETKSNWAFETVPQKGLNNRIGYQPRGRGLGGSTAINALIYMRGHRKDYDEWAENGCPGWSYDEVLPYFKKSENNEVFRDEFHGHGGELNVAAQRTDNPYQDVFSEACRESQIRENPDFNGAFQEGYGPTQVMQKNGERCSAANAFIHPIMNERENLSVYLNTQVIRVLFEGKKAVGVEVSHRGKTRTIRAKKEVILAAGALQTPQILQLSGVGNAKDLNALDIDVIHDLPEVGENLHDHPDYVLSYHLPDPKGLIGFSPKGMWNMVKSAVQYKKERRGMFATNYAEMNAFVRLQSDSVRPELQYQFVIATVVDHGRTILGRHGMSCHVLCLRPKSRGSIKLRTANYKDAPLIDPAILEHDDDIACMVAGAKRANDLIMGSSDLGKRIKSNIFAGHCKTDVEWEQNIRERTDTNYHPVGSCRMGIDENAVVDARTLKVNGIEGLRIADASVMPTIPGGNTTAPTLLIGEKCAAFIMSSD